MNDLIVPAPLARRIYAIAEEENRPIETVLAAMVENYTVSSIEEVEARLRAIGGITPPSYDEAEPPISAEEARELADKAGNSDKPLSEILIEERKQGY